MSHKNESQGKEYKRGDLVIQISTGEKHIAMGANATFKDEPAISTFKENERMGFIPKSDIRLAKKKEVREYLGEILNDRIHAAVRKERF